MYDGDDTPTFLARLVNELAPAKDFLNQLADEGGETECFIGIFADRLCDQLFPPKLLSSLGQLAIGVRLDYYGP